MLIFQKGLGTFRFSGFYKYNVYYEFSPKRMDYWGLEYGYLGFLIVRNKTPLPFGREGVSSGCVRYKDKQPHQVG